MADDGFKPGASIYFSDKPVGVCLNNLLKWVCKPYLVFVAFVTKKVVFWNVKLDVAAHLKLRDPVLAAKLMTNADFQTAVAEAAKTDQTVAAALKSVHSTIC